MRTHISLVAETRTLIFSSKDSDIRATVYSTNEGKLRVDRTYRNRTASRNFASATRLECIHGRRVRRFVSRIIVFDRETGEGDYSPGVQLRSESASSSVEQPLRVGYKIDELLTPLALRTAGVGPTQVARSVEAAMVGMSTFDETLVILVNGRF